MREITLSIPEKRFIIKAATESKRLDGRKLEDFRPFQVHFGKDWGSCFVTLGETKVLASVSCEVQEPQATRPNDGLLYLNVEVTAMAAPHLDGGSRSELGVHLNRMLEKCLKESKAVDLESLCIVADEKVWALRVDINVINHEGNLLDCSSLAALAALAHFKRPDVTTDGQEITIHDPAERDAIPITLHHYPACVTFAFMLDGDTILSDPTALEERVVDATLVFGVNAYRELCALHLGGTAVLPPKVIMRCATRAALRARELVATLKERLAQDLQDRQAERPIGYASCCELKKITSLSQDRVKIQLGKFRLSQPLKINLEERRMNVDVEESEEIMETEAEDFQIVDLGDNTAQLVDLITPERKQRSAGLPAAEPKYGEGGESQWIVEIDPTVASSSATDEIVVLPAPIKRVESIELSGDSDEDVVFVMEPDALEAAGRVGGADASKATKAKKKTPKSRPKQQLSKKRNQHYVSNKPDL